MRWGLLTHGGRNPKVNNKSLKPEKAGKHENQSNYPGTVWINPVPGQTSGKN